MLLMAFPLVHWGGKNTTARWCKVWDGENSSCRRKIKMAVRSCKDISETHSAAMQEQYRRQNFLWMFRSLRMDQGIQNSANEEGYRNQTKIRLLLYSKLKSTYRVILDVTGYSPGTGSGHPASFRLSFCPFLEKLRNAEIWTANTFASAHNFFWHYVGHEKMLLFTGVKISL